MGQTNTRIQEKRQGDELYHELVSKQNHVLKDGIRGHEYIANIDGTDYILISKDRFRLGKYQWDDLRVSAETTELVGSNAPDYRQFKNTETEFTGFSLYQTDSSQSATSVLTGAQVGFGSDFSMSFWLQSDTFSGTQGIFELGDFYIEWRFSDNIRIGGYRTDSQYLQAPIVDGQKTHVVFTLENTAGDDWIAKLFLNGSQVDTDEFTDASMPTYTADTPTIFPDNYRGRLDSLALFDVALTGARVISLYNNNNGTPITGNEDDLTYGWNFDEGSGATAEEVNGELVPFSISGDWGDGLVEASSSTGVLVKAFNPDVEQEVFFSVQFPHAWKEGSEIRPHVHWTPFSDGGPGSGVVWGLEYTWANILSDFSDTTIIYSDGNMLDTPITEGKHILSNFDPIDATGKTLSSMMLCRLFRAVDETGDTYDDDAGLLEFDIHYQIDSTGSDTEYTKI